MKTNKQTKLQPNHVNVLSSVHFFFVLSSLITGLFYISTPCFMWYMHTDFNLPYTCI